MTFQKTWGLDQEVKNALDSAAATSGTTDTTARTDIDAVEASVIVDLGAIRTAVIAALTAIDTLAGAVNTLATKLNADAGVTDTNYAAANAVNNASTSSPAALTTA